MELNRRQFFRICAGGMAGTTVASLGFLSSFSVHAETRQYKLLKAKETRNNCTYCSVGCGMLMYSLGDNAKNVNEAIYHIEGDADHPVSRGSLCPKGAGVLDYIHSENRLRYPQYRAPGSNQWQRISWDDAIERIARLMKKDRDENFIEKNAQGVTVNRWTTTGMLCSSAASNETGILDGKFTRARHGGDRLPGAALPRADRLGTRTNFWSRGDDQQLGRYQKRQRGADHGRQRRRSAPGWF